MGDDRVGPELAEQLDLLGQAGPALSERYAEGVVLDLVPADADAEPQAAAGEDVDLGGLLGDEGGLALREHEDAGDELERRW